MKAILVDDEQLALDFLERQLNKIGNIEVCGKFVNPLVGKEKIIQEAVDVVFLDIHLPEINGLELAEQILEEKPEVIIVFVTAYDEFAVNAFELNALDYLVKPIRAERLAKTITRIENQLPTLPSECSYETIKIHMNIGSQVTIEEETLHWRTTKAQELFLYLFQHREQLLHKSVIVDLLWPEYEPERAYSQLYTTIYHIRKTLKKFHDHFKIENTTEGYTLRTETIVFNIEEWENGIQSAPPLNKNTIDHYCELMKLNAGIYLHKYDYWWAETERHRLEQIWQKTAFQLANWYQDHGLMDEAINWYVEIENRQPEVEEAYFALMKIYAARDNHLLVNRQYQELTKFLAAELDILPSAYITKWYQEWKKKAVIT
ncbi:response regulator [Neobacillus sp.]|uniref:response regulator n=1 Tax=Neobacillus sp. TaxID=2675273 RepID=UPI002899EC68|nr:response regulator [Neobacillus sp.]